MSQKESNSSSQLFIPAIVLCDVKLWSELNVSHFLCVRTELMSQHLFSLFISKITDDNVNKGIMDHYCTIDGDCGPSVHHRSHSHTE